MRLFVIALMGLLVAGCGQRENPLSDEVQNLKDSYYACVRNSAASQMIALARQVRDGNAIAEMAFQACTTEESGMRVFVASLNGSQLQATAIMNTHKTILKQEIVSANPSPLQSRAK